MATTGVKQKWFNGIATLLWPDLTGDIEPSEVSMKLMEIGYEWHNAAIEEAAELCSQAEELPECIDTANMLERAMVLVRGALKVSQRATRLCSYSAAHKARGVLAVTVIDCGAVGMVDACQGCADFYARQRG